MCKLIIFFVVGTLASLRLVSASDFSAACQAVNGIRASRNHGPLKLLPRIGERALERLESVRCPEGEIFKNDSFKVFAVCKGLKVETTDQDAIMLTLKTINPEDLTPNVPEPGLNAIGFAFIRKSVTLGYLLVHFDRVLDLEFDVLEKELLVCNSRAANMNPADTAELEAALATANRTLLERLKLEVANLQKELGEKQISKQAASTAVQDATDAIRNRKGASHEAWSQLRDKLKQVMYMETVAAIKVGIVKAEVNFARACLEFTRLKIVSKQEPAPTINVVNNSELQKRIAEHQVVIRNWTLKEQEFRYFFRNGSCHQEKWERGKAGLCLARKIGTLDGLMYKKFELEVNGVDPEKIEEVKQKIATAEIEVDIAELEFVLAKMKEIVFGLKVADTEAGYITIKAEMVPKMMIVKLLIKGSRQSLPAQDEED